VTTVRTCPTCGHPIHSDEVAASLVGKQRKLYEIIAAAGVRGISSMQIMSQLYDDDQSGGAESPNIVCVMVRHVNLHLEHHRLAIKGRSGHGGLYKMVAQLPEPVRKHNSSGRRSTT